MTEVPAHLLKKATERRQVLEAQRDAEQRHLVNDPDIPLIDRIIALVMMDALEKRESAAYGGEMGDGGSGILEMQVEFYRAGRQGNIPEKWKKYETQLDPEYADYLRLKEKFKNKGLA